MKLTDDKLDSETLARIKADAERFEALRENARQLIAKIRAEHSSHRLKNLSELPSRKG